MAVGDEKSLLFLLLFYGYVIDASCLEPPSDGWMDGWMGNTIFFILVQNCPAVGDSDKILFD